MRVHFGVALLLAALVGFGAGVPAALADVGSTPEQTYVTNGEVDAIAVNGGTTYIGGTFSLVGPRTGPGVGINATSAQSTGLPQVSGPGAVLYAVVPDGSGGFYIGGSFTAVGGVARNNIAHILANGTVDAAFNPNADGSVSALALKGSTLYAGGSFSTIGGQSRSYVAALSTSTGQATSWNPNSNGFVNAIAVSGSTVYVAGAFSSIGGQSRSRLAGLDATTAQATSFNPSPDGTVWTLASSGSTLYAGGEFTSIGGQARNRIAAFDTSTGNVTSWNPNANYFVYALAVSPSGSTVYVGGAFTMIGGQSAQGIAGLDASTGDATGFAPPINGSCISLGCDVFAVAVSPDGSTVYAGGNFTEAGAQRPIVQRSFLAAFDASTGDATTWDPEANSDVRALAVSPDGSTVYAGGNFTSVNDVTRNHLAALNSAGTATSWDPEPDGDVAALAVSRDGSTVYAGGWFRDIGQTTPAARNYLAAIDSSTGNPTNWDPSANSGVRALALSPDGSTIYAGGDFTNVGGQNRNYIAAIDGSTGKATSWNPDADNTVRSLAVAPDGSLVYAGGDFSSIGGQSRSRLAALSGSTGSATSWNPDPTSGFSASIYGLVTSSDGSTIYAGGSFSSIGGQTRNGLAALSASTGNATNWNPNASGGFVNAVALSPDGSTLYAGGSFTAIGGQSRGGLAGVNTSTGTATAFNPGPYGGTPFALDTGSDGTLYVGGSFTGFDSAAQSGFAAFAGGGGKPSCRLLAPSHHVLLSKTSGALKLSVLCNQSAAVVVAGKVIKSLGKKRKTFIVSPVRATASAGKLLVVTVKLPGQAVAALKQGARESALFTLTASASTGRATATLKVPKLLPPRPTVSKLSPNHGPPSGGTLVTITGKNLFGSVTVHFGARPARIDKKVSATEVTVTAPKGSGTVDVTVTAAGGVSARTAADRYKY